MSFMMTKTTTSDHPPPPLISPWWTARRTRRADLEPQVGIKAAQVLSSVNPRDPRALGGHGVAATDIRLAHQLVQQLLAQNLVVRAPNDGLGETDERMIWEGLWEHYFAPEGLVNVLHKFLEWADVRPLFGIRIDSVEMEDGVVHVKGADRGGMDTKAFIGKYDCVVLCIPAPDVLRIEGLRHCLSTDSRHVLENVGYDQRTCEAHFFSGAMRPELAEAFQGKVELMVEDDNNPIQYLSWQNQKPATQNTPIALVVHSRPGLTQPLGASVDETLSQLTDKTPQEIAAHRVHSKSIPWHVSQMIAPMEAVVSDPPIWWQCMEENDGRVIIAGDFMTQSSFLGCVASADAAARAVVERASARDPTIHS